LLLSHRRALILPLLLLLLHREGALLLLLLLLLVSCKLRLGEACLRRRRRGRGHASSSSSSSGSGRGGSGLLRRGSLLHEPPAGLLESLLERALVGVDLLKEKEKREREERERRRRESRRSKVFELVFLSKKRSSSERARRN
jgi:hypothetical protein